MSTILFYASNSEIDWMRLNNYNHYHSIDSLLHFLLMELIVVLSSRELPVMSRCRNTSQAHSNLKEAVSNICNAIYGSESIVANEKLILVKKLTAAL